MKYDTRFEDFLKTVEKKNLNREETLRFLYEFVRDEIKFDFHPQIDHLSPSDVFNLKSGQCNNKTVLFFEMLKYFKFNARVHFSTIDKNIHRGFFPSLILLLTPSGIGHSWIEVEVEGKFIKLDGYINDSDLFNGAQIINARKGWQTGHSIAAGDCGLSLDFSLSNNNFVQMNAVKKELETSKSPMEYLRSSRNPNNVNFFKRFIYRLLLPVIRARVVRVREITENC